MVSEQLVDLSRLQFAATAMYHFLFVPLTIGMVWMLVIMESVYVMTGKTIYKDMTRFWGKLFGINFALGVTTGITLEFQFGTNWAYYSHYVGDIFGAPLAIEGLMVFFLESTFIGLFFFGWDRLSRQQHLLVTILMAVGTNLSALWILIANGWMQNPVGSEFSYETMRMELTDFWAVVFNPVAQGKFVHTVSAGYVTGAMFVLSISAWYLLRGRDVEFAKRSFRIAAAFGFASICSVIVLGDESGYALLQSTRPQTLGVALNDSPVGLLAWIVEKFRAWSDCDGDVESVFARDRLLTNVMLYWLTQTIASSVRLYWESKQSGMWEEAPEFVRAPTGVARYPKEEVLRFPRAWVERQYNVTRWSVLPHGGHFAAMEQPELFVDDLRAFFRTVR